MRSPVEIRGAALGHNADLGSRSTAVLSRVGGCEHLHFLHRVRFHAGDDLSIVSCTNRRSAIDRVQRVLRARPVNVESVSTVERES